MAKPLHPTPLLYSVASGVWTFKLRKPGVRSSEAKQMSGATQVASSLLSPSLKGGRHEYTKDMLHVYQGYA
jgi:hypothetical protein